MPQLDELLYLVMSARLDPRHAALHEEVTECLHTAISAFDDSTPGVPHPSLRLLQRCLVAVPELPPAQKQLLYDTFATADNRDAPSFARNLARVANDLAYLQGEALHASSAVL